MLTEKERLIAVLSGKKADRTPLICSGGMMSMANIEVMEMTKCYWPEAHRSPKKMARLVKAMHDITGIENMGVPFCMTVEAEAFGSQVNYGCARVHPRVVKEVMQTIRDTKKLKKLDPQRDGRMPVVLDAIGYLQDLNEGVPVIGNLVGPASLAGLVLEPLTLLRLMRKDKDGVHQLLSFTTDNLIEFAKAQVRYGADVITISEPTATGEILGPQSFSEFVIPYINRITAVLGKLGVKTIVHICGDLRTILYRVKNPSAIGPQVLQLEADCISIDAMVNIRSMKKLKKDLRLMGNVSIFLLEKDTPDRISRIARAIIRNGIDILAPACGLSPMTPTENIRAMSNVACTSYTESDLVL